MKETDFIKEYKKERRLKHLKSIKKDRIFNNPKTRKNIKN